MCILSFNTASADHADVRKFEAQRKDKFRLHYFVLDEKNGNFHPLNAIIKRNKTNRQIITVWQGRDS